MSIYETLWRNDKNRTLLISSIISLGSLIVAITFASLNYDTAGFLRLWYFVDQNDRHYSWGLVIAQIILLSLFYFFLLISLATLTEMRAKLPSWGTFISSIIISFLATWLVISIRPRGGGYPSNFTSGMQWTIFGLLALVMIASIFYIFFSDEEKPKSTEIVKEPKSTEKVKTEEKKE